VRTGLVGSEQRQLFDELIELLDPEPHDAALNMAIDEVLLRTATKPLLRVYDWARPAVSFGYFGSYESVRQSWPERELVRRWTGGGVVPHGADLTYTLIVPANSRFFRASARESYRLIHERIAAAASESGTNLQLTATAAPKISDACFENPACYDLLSDGEKIAGAAQRRAREGLLHQGSIQRAAVAEVLRRRLANAFASHVEARVLSREELESASILSSERYATDAWLRRR
jgi:lipoate-protein ligase A